MSTPNMPSIDTVAKFKAALNSERGALGPFMITSDPAFVEAAGHAGYDFALLDMEHGPGTFQSLQNLIRAANVAGVCPVVRVPRGTDIWIDQALDVGAGAVLVPQIDTAEQARAVVAAAKFSPVGSRGTCRFVRSAGYGAVPGSEYFSKAQETVVIIQAEGKKAVENLDEILEVPGIDVIFVGPAPWATWARSTTRRSSNASRESSPKPAPRASSWAASRTPWRAAGSGATWACGSSGTPATPISSIRRPRWT